MASVALAQAGCRSGESIHLPTRERAMSSSIVSNRISTVIAPELLQSATASLQAAVDALKPQLITLGTIDQRTMPRLGDKNEVFVTKALAYALSNPEFMPAFVDIAEFK